MEIETAAFPLAELPGPRCAEQGYLPQRRLATAEIDNHRPDLTAQGTSQNRGPRARICVTRAARYYGGMRSWRLFFAIACSAVLCSVGGIGCSSSSPGAAGTSAGGSPSGGSGAPNGGGGAPTGGVPGGSTPYDSGMTPVGQLDPPNTKLPPLPFLTNVIALQGDDGASITFDPIDGALDYRVYALPSDDDISVASSGAVVVHNGTYRCAGNREAAPTYIDDAPMPPSAAIHAQVNQTVGGYKRTLDNATLGYVYTQPATGLVPVYALGDSDPNADSGCYFARWAASRVKKYTTSSDERDALLKNFARDDGIAFYVPATADSTTTNVYFEDPQGGGRYYFPDGPEAALHANKMAAFPVLTTAAKGTMPLMRVYYQNVCGWSHDELAVGQERFNRVYHQGDKLPSFSLLWTGITVPTTLVVEALDAGCPFQGYLSPQAFPTSTAMLGTMPIVHQPWVTMDDARGSSATGELFINGQHEATNQPKAIARSFIGVKPQPHPKMDFFANFAPGSTPEAFATVDCGVPGGNCYQTWRQQSATFDQIFIDVESGPAPGTGLFAAGPMLAEWWVSYTDVAADTNGKYRLTANQKATMSSSSFLHVTMEVDAYSTARRYPQILISDGDVPVQYSLQSSHTILVQSRAEISETIDFPVDYELQLCKLRTWDVNNQCPVYDLHHALDSAGKVTHLAPNDEFGEHASVDHRVLFDVYTSTDRTYLFLDGQPYGCAKLPAGAAPTGPVTVTWGDALYHSAVDHTFAFHTAHMQVEQRRHFDNLGFSSGVSAPSWDESRLPCAAPISL